MITRADIKQETNSVTYSRGYRIWKEGGVRSLQIKEPEDVNDSDIRMTAEVKGSGEKIYCVEIAVDEAEGEILSDACECPAHKAYWGLCKHCVAVLLSYLEWRKDCRGARDGKTEKTVQSAGKNMEELDRLLEAMGVQRGMRTGLGKTADNEKKRISGNETIQKKFQTSPGLSELLANYAMRDKARYLPQAKNGQVRLEVRLRLFYHELRAEFRIGIRRMYVLKSISQFSAAVLNLEQFSYGSELSFLHCIQAFTPECRSMVNYMTERAREKKTLYQTPYGKWFSCESDRYLYLERWTVDGFMDALKQMKFTLETESEQERQGTFAEGVPGLELSLKKRENAVQLEIPSFRYVEGNDFTYFFLEAAVYRVPDKELEGIMILFRYLQERTGNICTIGREDFPVFFQNLLPVLERLFVVKKDSADLNRYLPPEVSFEFYLDLPEPDTVVCRLFAVYGDRKYPVFRDVNSIWEMARGRDVRKETELYSCLLPFFTAYDEEKEEMVIRGEDAVYEFLSNGVKKMRQYGEIFLSDTLKSVRVRPAPAVSAGVSVEGNLLDLTFESGELTHEELAAILSRYDRKKKYYRLKNGDFIDMEDGMLGVLAGIGQDIGMTEREMKSGSIRMPAYRALSMEGYFKEKGIPVERDRGYRTLIRSMKTVEENDFELPSGLNVKLRPYQAAGFRWLKTLCRNGFGGILADDMGLGKTLQVIAFLLSEISESPTNARRRTLIVAPASLVYNWENEIRRFAPALNVRAVTGAVSERREEIRRLGEKDIAVTSYDLLKRDLDEYRSVPFFCEVLDEAQFIKNHATRSAKAVREIQAGFRLALTGTPMENRLSELWSIFDYLMPGFLYSYQKFREQTEIPVVREKDRDAMERLQRMIRPFILRRLKKDVLKDLPDKIEKNMFANMEKEQEELYQARAQRLAAELSGQSEEEFRDSRIRILAEITRLRQLCCDPALLYEGYHAESAKTDLCMELVKNALEGGHRILLFSQFTSMLDILVRNLEREKISVMVLTGATSKEKRTHLVERFQNGEGSVFCISLKAGGTGLNLTGADIVIHFDPWWNAAAENQATDRAHRIGQENVVTVYRLITRGTIEEKILKLQDAKRELAEQVLSGDEIKSASFTREELMELLTDI